MKQSLLILLLVLVLAACKKDRPPVRPAGTVTSGKRLIICNEGNFGQGNASVTVYDPASGAAVTDAYAPVNGNQYIGDVLQSVAEFGTKYYWVVNNSKKVVVTDKSFAKLSAITGFISPRYMTFVSNNKAYVTNLQLNNALPNYVQVLDLNANTISKSIRLDGWSEQMAQSYGRVFVCNQSKKYVYILDPLTDLVSDSIFLNATSACVVKDRNEKLWISCNANAGANLPPRLVRIDPVSFNVEADIALPASGPVTAMTLNGQGDVLYLLMGDVYRMAITDAAPSLAVSQGNRVFYNISVDPSDENLYITDAIDYNQAGTLLRYTPSLNLSSSTKTGIIPGYMLWDH